MWKSLPTVNLVFVLGWLDENWAGFGLGPVCVGGLGLFGLVSGWVQFVWVGWGCLRGGCLGWMLGPHFEEGQELVFSARIGRVSVGVSTVSPGFSRSPSPLPSLAYPSPLPPPEMG